MRVAAEIVLTDEKYAELTKQGVLRALKPEACTAGAHRAVGCGWNTEQGHRPAVGGAGRAQVSRWRERYARSRLAGIERNLPRGVGARQGSCRLGHAANG